MKIEASVVTTKGLGDPGRLRRWFRTKKGTTVTFLEDRDRIIMQSVRPELIRGLRGSLKKEPSALTVLLDKRKRERHLSAVAKQSASR